MSARTVIAGLLFGTAVLAATAVAPVGRATRARLSRIIMSASRRRSASRFGFVPQPGFAPQPRTRSRPARGSAAVAVSGQDGQPPRRADRIRLGAALGAFTTWLVVGGWPGALLGVVVAVGLDRALRRLEPADARRRRQREAAELPLAADLLAAALRAGAPVDRAVEAVAEALGGPLGERLDRVGRTLRLGGGPTEAWAYLTPVLGGDRMSAAAVRSSDSGAALADALNRLADDLRADRATRVEAMARRAGVLIVLPLGLCFLPAFILAGLVPVIVAVLGDVL